MIEERHGLDTTEELGRWYNRKYKEMEQCWDTPPAEINEHLDFIPVINDWVPLAQSGRRVPRLLLDIGCGDGSFLYHAQQRCACQGIEISTQAIRYAQQKYNGAVNVYLMSIEYMQGAEMYDYIVSMGSLEHVIDLPRALTNIRNLLKKDGVWYFHVPNEHWVHDDQINERKGDVGSWRNMLHAYGLETVKSKEWNHETTGIVGTRREI